ncbi:hypothetical protein IJX73_02730 [bacterium]|nr:hypothetical protein [bacterium]MBQ9149825.1 hypothetical protein [bacterium]
MKGRKILDRLEHDLSHYMISELCKADPTKRGSADLYKYKGLSLDVDTKQKGEDKTFKVRIGVLEAEFKIGSGDKTGGSLNPEDEKAIMLWMSQSDHSNQLMNVFSSTKQRKTIGIVPFDLEEYFMQS